MKVSLRGRSASHSPKAHAVWTFSSIKLELDHFLEEVYPDIPHEGIGGLPRNLFAKSLADQGSRPVRYIEYGDLFQILTMPLYSRQVTVKHNRGLRINYAWYWHSSFKAALWRKTKVTVRYDPENAGYTEALLGDSWVRCKCLNHYFLGFPWREIEALTQECLAEFRLTNKRKRMSPEVLERFIGRIRAKEIDLQREKRELLSGNVPQSSQPALPAPSPKGKTKKERITDDDFASVGTFDIGANNE